MFTGIVEHIGTVRSIEPADGGMRLAIDAGVIGDIPVGASIAVNGACLTVTGVSEGVISLDVVTETLSRTNLGGLEVGSRVNLERAMAASGRFDGHIVQGHIDATAEVIEVSPEGDGRRLKVRLPEGSSHYVVEKGSVAIDGVSLTVANIDHTIAEFALIPHTLEASTLGLRNPGDEVNLELDVLAKYVERLLN